jgi:hypothetical protein
LRADALRPDGIISVCCLLGCLEVSFFVPDFAPTGTRDTQLKGPRKVSVIIARAGVFGKRKMTENPSKISSFDPMPTFRIVSAGAGRNYRQSHPKYMVLSH